MPGSGRLSREAAHDANTAIERYLVDCPIQRIS
jgi:hypothetical protein